MAMTQRSIVVGVFDNRAAAEGAVQDLRAAGFTDDRIGIAVRHDDAAGTATMTGEPAVAHEDEGSHAGTGAVTGALAGAGLGALAGFAVLSGMIPVIGPAIAGGTLGIILSNAAAGAGVAGLVGALVGAGASEEEAHYYQGEFEAGRTIVTVHADGRADEVGTILRRHGAFDMQSRPEGMPAAGRPSDAGVDLSGMGATHAGRGTSVTSASGAGAMASGSGPAASRTAEGGETIRLREERLRAEKTPETTGQVNLRKEVTSERRSIDVPVEREEVVIERHAPGTTAGAGIRAADLKPGEEIRIPIRDEVVDVSKEAVVTEEVAVGKRKVQDTERVTDTVRKEQIRVETEGDAIARDTDRTRP